MKLRKRGNGELKEVYCPPYGSAIEFCLNPFDIFFDCVEINLPDVGVYHAVGLGCYNLKTTGRYKREVIKFYGNVKVKPDFIDQVLETLREQKQD
jgi:hypothetical protein